MVKKEKDFFSGSSPREFFIEAFPADDVDALLDEFDPETHNTKWDAERQKPAPNPDKLMANRRAVAFMVAGKMGVHRRYKETELRAHLYGRARMIRNHNFLCQTDMFSDDSLQTYKKG